MPNLSLRSREVRLYRAKFRRVYATLANLTLKCVILPFDNLPTFPFQRVYICVCMHACMCHKRKKQEIKFCFELNKQTKKAEEHK